VNEKYWLAMAMESYGGSFARALGGALRLADDTNYAIILSSFADLLKPYHDHAARLKTEDDTKDMISAITFSDPTPTPKPKPAWPDNGIHENVPFAIYRSDDINQSDTWETAQGKAVSKSLITDFLADPDTWKASKKKETTASMGFGSLVDCLLLETDKFESRYCVSPYSDFRKKEAQEWRDEMAAAGVEIVTEDKLAAAQDACDAIRNHDAAAAILYGAKTQVAFRHKTRHGLASKGLIDIVPLAEDFFFNGHD